MSGALALATTVAQASPKLELGDQDFKFGYAPPNAKIAHRFVLRSTGDEPLRIVQVNPGCGCTKAPLEKETAAPGDSTSVEIIFSTGSYRGSVSKNPSVTTNASLDPLMLRFTANVVPYPDSTYPLRITPFKVAIPSDQSGAKVTVTLTNVSDRSVHPVLVDLPHGVLDVTLPSTIEPHKSAEAIIAVSAKTPAGGFEKSVTIQVDDEAQSRFTIPVVRVAEASPSSAAGSATK